MAPCWGSVKILMSTLGHATDPRRYVPWGPAAPRPTPAKLSAASAWKSRQSHVQAISGLLLTIAVGRDSVPISSGREGAEQIHSES